MKKCNHVVDSGAVFVSEIYPEVKRIYNPTVVFSAELWNVVCGVNEDVHVMNICSASLTARIKDVNNYTHIFTCWLPDESGQLSPILLKVIFDEMENGESYVGIMGKDEREIFFE